MAVHHLYMRKLGEQRELRPSNSTVITSHLGQTVINRMDYSIPGCVPAPHDKDLVELQGYPRDWARYDWDRIWLSQFPLKGHPGGKSGIKSEMELFNEGVRFLKGRV